MVTGSFDSTAGVWRRDEADHEHDDNEVEIGGDKDNAEEKEDWEFSLVLEGHDSELKGVGFSPSGQYLATCSRDKSVWIWEEIGAEGEDEWETVAVLQEHEADVKCVAWSGSSGDEGEVLASGSYDDSVRLWREDEDGEWGCVALLLGHTGTVWGLAWESYTQPAEGAKSGDVEEGSETKHKRLISCSADETIRVWTRTSAADPRAKQKDQIPSTMRHISSEETWVTEAILPKAHSRPIYAVSWSSKTGRVVSCGSDSLVVIYEERPLAESAEPSEGDEPKPKTEWVLLATLKMAHGPYEINHVTWCPRFDNGHKGDIEGIVTTGDDGAVRMWAVEEDSA